MQDNKAGAVKAVRADVSGMTVSGQDIQAGCIPVELLRLSLFMISEEPECQEEFCKWLNIPTGYP